MNRNPLKNEKFYIGNLYLKINQNVIPISPNSDVLYIESYGNYVKIFCLKGIIVHPKNLKHWENYLYNNNYPNFLRVHQSFIINLLKFVYFNRKVYQYFNPKVYHYN